jgi:cation-transporting P-type ATPase E
MKASRLAVALGSGSQLAKSVADGVLVTDRFAAIPEAIGEGRQIIRNVQRVAKLFVTKSVFAAFVIITFGLTTAGFPLLPRHLSLAGVFTVGIPGFALALSRDTAPPDTEPFVRSVARFAIPAGVVTGAATMVAYLAVAPVKGYSTSQGRTAAVLAFVAVGLYVLLVLDADRMRASGRHTVFVLGLVSALAAGFLALWGWGPARDFFALSQPSIWLGIVVIAVFVASVWLLGKLGLSPYLSDARRLGSGDEPDRLDRPNHDSPTGDDPLERT